MSVERLLDPTLVGKPVVVGGSKGNRGVVTAASYEVRAFGVHSAMPMAEALQKAPNAVFLPTRHGVYSPYARKVRDILTRYSPEVQTASIDEFFIDFYGCERLYEEPDDTSPDATIERVIRQMRQTIQDETGLPGSAGIGCTRTIAKIASGFAKPAGVYMVSLGEELDFVRDLSVRKFPGIGPVAEQKLLDGGITTIGQLLENKSGSNRGRFRRVHEMVGRGIDPHRTARLGEDRPSFLEHDDHGTVGSISNERTFSADVGERDKVRTQLLKLAERVCWRARKREIRARTISLKLRYSDFQTLTRSHSLERSTNDEKVVFPVARRLLRTAWRRDLPIRLVGIALTNLTGPSPQLRLPFAEQSRPAVGSAIDEVRSRFGYDAIRFGAVGATRWLEKKATLDTEDDLSDD